MRPLRPIVLTLVAAAFTVLCLPGGALAQSSLEGISEEKLRRYYELAKPGPEHEMLASLAGEWSQVVKMWPEPGGDPVELRGRSEARMILGGRFLESTSWMAGSDEPLSVLLLGFDRRAGELTAMGMDTSGTYWVTASGKPEPSMRRAVLSGTDEDRFLEHTQIYDFVLELIDNDTFTWSIVFHDEAHTKGGPPFKMVEIMYERETTK